MKIILALCATRAVAEQLTSLAWRITLIPDSDKPAGDFSFLEPLSASSRTPPDVVEQSIYALASAEHVSGISVEVNVHRVVIRLFPKNP